MSPSLLAVFVCLAAASRVVHAVTCPDDACGIVDRTDPNRLAPLLPDPVLCDCTCDDAGNTLFHRSVPSKCGQCIEMLVAAGCDVDVQDSAGNTSLHDAAAQCINVATTSLLDQGADPAATNNVPDTPLCVVGTDSPPNPSECGIVARNIIGVSPPLPPSDVCFEGSTTFVFCPCNVCYSGRLPFDEAIANGFQGVADVIGQDCGMPDQCNSPTGPPCPN